MTTTTTRRTLVKHAAWATPTVLLVSAAPAMAASCGQTGSGTVDFGGSGNYTRTSTTAGSASVPVAGQANVGVTFAVATPAGYTLNAANLVNNGLYTVANGSATAGLQLYQQRTTNTSTALGQVLTITFSRPVYNLVVPLGGFTSSAAASGYIDNAFLNGSPVLVSTGSNVQGTGTSGSPFRNINPSTSPNQGAATAATIRYAGPVTSFTITYSDSSTTTNDQPQAIALLNMTFDVKPVGC